MSFMCSVIGLQSQKHIVFILVYRIYLSTSEMTGSDNNELAPSNANKKKKRNIVVQKNIKHPLLQRWSFWIFMNDKKSWEENLVKLTTFDTVEDFWCLYHHMKKPSELCLGQDYALFKEEIRPMWEDQANKKGGRWLISYEKGRECSFDTIWLYVNLLLIGENFENSKAVNGAVINVKANTKIGVWMKNSKNKMANLEIGHRLKKELGITRINFHEHNSFTNMYII